MNVKYALEYSNNGYLAKLIEKDVKCVSALGSTARPRELGLLGKWMSMGYETIRM